MPGGIHPPLSQWLLWPAPNYVDPITKPKYVLFFACLFGPLSVLFLAARLWVRVRVQKSAGWDDWLMLASFFPVMGLTIIFPLVTEKFHFNRHFWDLEFKYFPFQRHYVMAIYALFSVSSGLVKMSILLFYRRLSTRTVSSAYRWTLRITITSIGLSTVIFTFVSIFMCSPVSAFWNQEDIALLTREGGYQYKCMNEGAEIVANGIVSTIQDFIAASLPAILCWKLQMPTRQKLALFSVFAVSYVAVALGAMRAYSSYRLFFVTYDVTWAACDVWLWSLLEIHIGSACANAPALKAFYTHYFGRGSAGSRPTNTSSYRSKLFSSGRDTSGYLSESHTAKQGAIIQMHTQGQRDAERQELDFEFVSKDKYGEGWRESGMSDVHALPSMPRAARVWDARV